MPCKELLGGETGPDECCGTEKLVKLYSLAPKHEKNGEGKRGEVLNHNSFPTLRLRLTVVKNHPQRSIHG